MAFTIATVTASYVAATGGAAQGEVQFTLTKGTTVTATLDDDGDLSQQLVSTQDPATTSPSQIPLWRVDERVTGSSVSSFYIPVPSGGVSVSLESLSPFVSGAPVWT
jgi:hypothetical protein